MMAHTPERTGRIRALAVRVAGTPDTDWERLSPSELWLVEYGLQSVVDKLELQVQP